MSANKTFAKRISHPVKATILRLMYVKVNGKRLFVNRYTRRIPVYSSLLKKTEGIMLGKHTASERAQDYKRWFKSNYPTSRELELQKSEQEHFKNRPLISILVPTYNTNIVHLRECIESVIEQSYTNWQLCLADDASTNQQIIKIFDEYAKKDERVVFITRKKNGHICRATNSALELAKGQYVALLDHDDVLWPNALFEVVKLINNHPDAKFIYSDEDKIDTDNKKHLDPFFKPDWSFDFLRSINYITHFAVLEKELVKKVGGFRPGYEGAQDWDLFLRASRQLDYVYHIPTVLYSWRKSPTSTAEAPSAKDYAYKNQEKALRDDIKARKLKARLSWQIPFSMWRVGYTVLATPRVSIIIPTKDQYDYIDRCLRSIIKRTTYANYEVVVTDTGSSDNRVWDLYESYKKEWPNIKIVKWNEKPFNFASACNFGAKESSGDYLLFLNNDTEVLTDTWLEDMLGYAAQDQIGAVGCHLLYPDGKLQHGGIILGVGGQNGTPGIAGHYFPAFVDTPPQDPAQLVYVGGTRNFTAVTAACVMVSRDKFSEVEGFDPIFQIAFNDVDFCLKLFDRGYRNVYLPHVTLYHYESISVGLPGEKQRDLKVFDKEIKLMLKKWGKLIENDPFYHPEFRRDVASARLKA